MKNKIPYGRQEITKNDIDAVVNVLKSDYLTQGPEIKKFEKLFAEYVGSNYAIAVSNGTAALHLCALSLNLKKGDKVITTPITFAATANCVRYTGADVVFADIDPETLLIDIDEVKKILKKHPKGSIKGIIPVDFSGRPVNLEKFRDLADEYNLWIIEDACHSPGGFYYDSNNAMQKCGNGKHADLSIFSFHPVKHIAAGEGGMITTNSVELYNRIKNLRTHGIQQIPEKRLHNHGIWYYEMQELGYNYRLTDIQASLGISQLSRASEGLKKRNQIATNYNNFFKNKSYVKSQSGLIEGHAYHLYVIEVEKRDKLINYLRDKNIFCQVHYIPLHLMPYYSKFGWKKGDFPNAENYYKNCLSLPIFPSLKQEEQNFVLDQISKYYESEA